MRSFLDRLLRRAARAEAVPEPPSLDDVEREWSWMFPPAGDAGREAWDTYWREHIAHGLGPPIFDLLFDDRGLVAEMMRRGTRTVLCAGNGISMEPRALAAAGMSVAALDISPVALEMARTYPSDHVPIEHFIEREMVRPAGNVEYVVGDILDPACCPGPFDVVIERRTAQDYPPGRLADVITALADRLAPRGMLVSHCHDGAWKPPAAPRHVVGTWLKENGWTIWAGGPGRPPPGRVAWLCVSTG